MWGLIDLNGKEVIKPTYDDIGCTATNASSNVLIIPELDAFVFKKNRTYGIASFDGEVIIQSVLNRIYIDTSKDEKTYSMIYKDKTYNVVDYIEDMEKRKSNTTTNTTTNTTNATNTTNTTNKTNTTNTTNSTKTTNTSTNKTNQTNTTNSTTNTTNKTNTTNNTTNNTNKTNTSNSTTSNTVVITNSTR